MSISSREYIENLIPDPLILEQLETAYIQNKLNGGNTNYFVYDKNTTNSNIFKLPFYRNMFLTDGNVIISDTKYIFHEVIPYKNRKLNVVIFDNDNEIFNLNKEKYMSITFNDIDNHVIGVVF